MSVTVSVCVATEGDAHKLHEEEEKQGADHRLPPHQQVIIHLAHSICSLSVYPLSSFTHCNIHTSVSYIHSFIHPSIQKTILSSSLPTVSHWHIHLSSIHLPLVSQTKDLLTLLKTSLNHNLRFSLPNIQLLILHVTVLPFALILMSTHFTLMQTSTHFYHSPLVQGAVDGELDPEDDPNNQGEDEFEEAEDERPQHRVAEEEEEVVEEEEEPQAPAQHRDTHPGPEQPAVEEELVVSVGVREEREHIPSVSAK